MTPTNVVEEMFQGETSTLLKYRKNGKRRFEKKNFNFCCFFCFFLFDWIFHNQYIYNITII